MNNNLAAPDEQIFWQIAVPEPQRLGSGYLLTLRADWIGPVAGNQSFYIENRAKSPPKTEPALFLIPRLPGRRMQPRPIQLNLAPLHLAPLHLAPTDKTQRLRFLE